MPYDPTQPTDKGGRPTKLTDELIDKVRQLVMAGNYVEVACAASGITQSSYYRWIREGKALEEAWGEDPEYWPSTLSERDVQSWKFYQSMKQATAEAEAYAVTTVRAAMPKNWQAAMTYLERRFPGRWKRRDEVSVSNPFDVQGEVNASADEAALLDDPEASRLMHQALGRMAQRELEAPSVEGTIEDAEVIEASEDGSTGE
jgi:transposase